MPCGWLAASTADVSPFPLLPPSSADKTDLKDQSAGWLEQVLVANRITNTQAKNLRDALRGNYMGEDIESLVNDSGEPIPEMKLLDAIETFIAVELQVNARLPEASRVNIFNGVYHI